MNFKKCGSFVFISYIKTQILKKGRSFPFISYIKTQIIKKRLQFSLHFVYCLHLFEVCTVGVDSVSLVTCFTYFFFLLPFCLLPVLLALAVERRPSPSDAPQGDWPCVVIGSSFTTQKRLRSRTPGISSPRPPLLMIAAKTPSQCTMHASERTRDRAPLRVQGPSAPLHTPPPTRMPKASE